MDKPLDLLRDDTRIIATFPAGGRVRQPTRRYHYTSINDARTARAAPREDLIVLATQIHGALAQARVVARKRPHQLDTTVGCLEAALDDVGVELERIAELEAWEQAERDAQL